MHMWFSNAQLLKTVRSCKCGGLTCETRKLGLNPVTSEVVTYYSENGAEILTYGIVVHNS